MRGGQILMLERARGMMIGFWRVPGRIVDPGESPPEAAASESALRGVWQCTPRRIIVSCHRTTLYAR